MANPYSALDADDFLAAAQALLPPGRAWSRAPDATLTKYLGALADIKGLFHAIFSNIADVELDPGQTGQLLTDFERAWGLPDPCTPDGQTVDQRRKALVTRIADKGGLNPSRYVELAASIGYDITVSEFFPFTCESRVGDFVCGPEWRFYWQINAAETTVTDLTCAGTCAEALRSWGNENLECIINSRNRATRVVLFSYGA